MESVTAAQGHRAAFAIALLCSYAASSPLVAEEQPAPTQGQARVPHPSVTITLADPSPVIGISGETVLRIVVADPPDEGMPLPRVLCSVGQVEDLGRDGPATFSARYILPAGRYPQPAIIVAEFSRADWPWPVRGMTTVRLRAATTPSLRTDPGAQVTLRVGDRDFGPQKAPADGIVRIPVVVPPGVDIATARSVNEHGKATEQTIDLHVPYCQRVLFAAPLRMRAGTSAEVAVYAVEPSGRPANGSTLQLRAVDARVTPLGSRIPGEARFLVRAPSVLRERNLRLEAQIQGQSTTRLGAVIKLQSGPATGLTLDPESSFIAPHRGGVTRIFVGAEDAFGNPVDASAAAVLVDDKPATVQTASADQPTIVVHAPPRGQKRVVVEGVLDGAYAARSIPVGVAPRPRVAAPLASPSPVYTLTPRVGFLWNLGEAEGATVFLDGLAFRMPRMPDLGLGLSVGVLQTWFVAENAYAATKGQLTTVPLLFRTHFRANAGRAFVGIGGGGGVALGFARLNTYGNTVSGHSLGGAAEAMVEVGLHLHHGHLVVGSHYLLVYFAQFSSGDSVSGNAAGIAFDIGYRLGF